MHATLPRFRGYVLLLFALILSLYLLRTPVFPRKRRRVRSDKLATRDDLDPALRFAHEPPNKTNPRGDLICFLYDRPPRSGSTTIGKALKKCVVDTLGFEEPSHPDLQDEYRLVEKMFSALNGTRRALVSKHLKLNRDYLRELRARCRMLYYVSSCREMKERIWSRQKYRFMPGNVNSTLTKKDHALAVKKLMQDTRNEPFLENHPYMDRQERSLGLREEEKLVPDFVVRNVDGLFARDLGGLLEALGCSGEFVTTNMHANKRDGEDVLSLIELKLGNVIFRKLKAHGDRVNQGGLKRAREWMRRALAE